MVNSEGALACETGAPFRSYAERVCVSRLVLLSL
jgi:hypothetical protein